MTHRANRLTAAPGSGGVLAARAEDFWVDEVLPYTPIGQGQHLFLRVTKAEATTPQAVGRIAERLGVTPADIGVAGLKDHRAVTRQWMSVPWPVQAPLPELDTLPTEIRSGFEGGALRAAAAGPKVWITDAIRHRNKLKRGHVRANRFRIRIREVPAGGFERAVAAAETLGRIGMPNRFGPQRYGRDGDNAGRARRILAGEERPPRSRRARALLFSALQSELFDRVLVERHRRGWWSTALMGDVMVRHDPPAMFDVTDPAADQPRVERLEISPSGPLFGKSTRPVRGEAAALEGEVLAGSGLSDAEVARLGPGSRRALRLPVPEDLDISASTPNELMLAFSLPAGAYATVLLEEICDLRAVRPTTSSDEANDERSAFE